MRVFVTGATGFIGSVLVKELISAGHQVLGLARNDVAANLLATAGAEVYRGDLEDLDSLRSGVAASDGVIHTGFVHDFARFKEVCEIDRHVIETMGSILTGSNRPLIITSGTGFVANGQLAIEKDMPVKGPNPRIASEEAADQIAAQGVLVSVVRLPPSVHGDGDKKGFIPRYISIARKKGISAYVGEGANLWPAVHRLDAARLFKLAVEKASAPGTRFHAVADEGVSFRDIAEVIGKQLNVPVVSISPEEATTHFEGPMSFAASLNNPTSSKQTQQTLGWHPNQPGLIEDLNQGSYFTI
jgi:nucleoside-diphosphate-sugar epimerase